MTVWRQPNSPKLPARTSGPTASGQGALVAGVLRDFAASAVNLGLRNRTQHVEVLDVGGGVGAVVAAGRDAGIGSAGNKHRRVSRIPNAQEQLPGALQVIPAGEFAAELPRPLIQNEVEIYLGAGNFH